MVAKLAALAGPPDPDFQFGRHGGSGVQLGPLRVWPGPGRRQPRLWKLSSQNVLRSCCGLSEAAEDSRCNGCPIKSVSEPMLVELESPAPG